MKRRFFLKAAGTSVLSASAGFAAHGPVVSSSGTVTSAALQRLRETVQAQFGPSFRLLTCDRSDNVTTCTIEDRGNRFRIASSDLDSWQIVQAPRL